MDAGRFDALSRSLKTTSRRGALRAIGVVGVAGLAERLGVTVAEARNRGGKHRRGKKKNKTAECPECVCPTPDTCPNRICCICNTPGDTECRTFPAPATAAQCNDLCGPLGSSGDAETSDPDSMTACDFVSDLSPSCRIVRC